jgi:hypothetical protein
MIDKNNEAIMTAIRIDDWFTDRAPKSTGISMLERKAKIIPFIILPQYICPNPGIIRESTIAVNGFLLYFVFIVSSVILMLLEYLS